MSDAGSITKMGGNGKKDKVWMRNKWILTGIWKGQEKLIGNSQCNEEWKSKDVNCIILANCRLDLDAFKVRIISESE